MEYNPFFFFGYFLLHLNHPSRSSHRKDCLLLCFNWRHTVFQRFAPINTLHSIQTLKATGYTDRTRKSFCTNPTNQTTKAELRNFQRIRSTTNTGTIHTTRVPEFSKELLFVTSFYIHCVTFQGFLLNNDSFIVQKAYQNILQDI